jgi:hypothetical protein
LLTGGGDKPYALGIAAALTAAGIQVDFIGSDDLEVRSYSQIREFSFVTYEAISDPM